MMVYSKMMSIIMIWSKKYLNKIVYSLFSLAVLPMQLH